MARTVCGREDRANRSPAWTRRERCGRPRPCRTRHRAPRAGRGCGRMRQVGVHHHDPVEPVACDTLEDATVQIGPGPSAHLDVHGQGPTSRAETTGVSSSESSSTSSSSHAMARPAMAPATRSAKQLEARGLSALRAIPLRTLRYRSGRAPRRTSMCTDRGQRAAPRRRGCLRPNRRRRAAARTRWRGQPWRRSRARPSSSRLGASLSVGTVICSAGWWSGQGKQPPVVLSKRGVQLGRPQRAAAGVLRLEGTITYRAATGSQKQFATSTVDTTTHFGRVQGRRP